MMSETFKNIHKVLFIVILFFFVSAIIVNPSISSIFEGFIAILRAPDILVTDYVYVGGLASALLNSAITTLISLGMLVAFKHEAKSATISNVWLVLGFSFFGKNPLTVVPIFLGGWLYSRFMRQNFNVNILTCLVAASLSPAVTQKMFIWDENTFLNIIFSISMGVLIGFIFDPIAKNIFKAHDGFNLYNGGFTAGMLAIIITSIFSSYNIFYEINDQWSSGNNFAMSLILYILSIGLVFIGLYMHRDVGDAFRRILSMRKYQNDYYPTFGYVCYVNMGILGIFCTTVALFMGFEINGLVLGAILSVMGFGANGKQLYSISSLMVGIFLGTLISPLDIQYPGISVAFFFVSCLSPIPAKFGWHWGVISGIFHLHIVTSLAVPSGGINLYNNGVAAGFVTVLILPLIRCIRQRRENESVRK